MDRIDFEATTATVSPPRPKVDVPSEFVEKLWQGSLPFTIRGKHRIPLFSTSASAQDLRLLDMEEEEEEEKVVREVSPRGVLEDGPRYSDDSESSSPQASTSYSETRAIPKNNSLWRGLVRIWRKKSMQRFLSFPPAGVLKQPRRRSSRSRSRSRKARVPRENKTEERNIGLFKPSWKNFTELELRNATNNFSPENLIGKGGYAEVYKGCLEDGQLVAIKKITRGMADEMTINFLSELGIIVHIDHPNTAKLVGVGVEGGMYLVFELSTKGSLANLLHDSDEKLDWGVRQRIATGTAEGLEYLHEKCQRRIIHRDIKSANILLTEEFEPQICDFGLAKWLPNKLTHHVVSAFEGTFGYLAPEYSMHGIIDEKTDVYSFGVLLLELISGRKALDSSQHSLVMWARPLLENNNLEELVDPSVKDSCDEEQLMRVMQTASLCIQQSSIMRPCMSQVIRLLKGEESRSEFIRVCQRPFLQRTYSEEFLDAQEYNATRYLSDLTRHRQVALDF